MRVVLSPEDYPKTVKIGKSTYHIVFADRIGKRDKRGKKTYGTCTGKVMKVITISKAQDPDEMLATFWHEILHAFEYEFGIEIGHGLIDLIEYGLAGVHSQFPFRR